MTADVADQLRALARGRTEGRLTLAAYRQLRRPLLDGLVGISEEQSSVTTQPRALARRDASPSRDGAATSDRVAAAKVRASRGVLVVVGGIIAVAAIVLIWRHGGSVRNGSSSSAPGTQARTADAAEPIRQLLQPLLDNSDWSDARLIALNSALLEAGHARIAAAQDADWFNAFVEQVRSRVREQQALAGAPLTADRSPLAALATTLGIDLASPDTPIRPPSGSIEPSAIRPTPREQARVEARAAAQPTAGHAQDVPQNGTHRAVARAILNPGGTADAGRSSLAGPSAAAPVSARAESGASGDRKYPACSAALDHVRLNFCQDLLGSGGTAPLLAVIPPGAFMMGNAGAAEERPVHRVIISHPFAMSVYEVSQSEYRLYCESARTPCPAQPWTENDLPVVEVSWRDANDYARWLSQATGERYRLPTEAEWEYAARAGQSGLYPSGGDSLSQTDAYFTVTTTLTEPTPRTQRFNANAWRLMHMIGNVREWVADDWARNFDEAPTDGAAWGGGDPSIKVVRGGSYVDRAIKLRLTTREPLPANTRDRVTGIRLLRELH